MAAGFQDCSRSDRSSSSNCSNDSVDGRWGATCLERCFDPMAGENGARGARGGRGRFPVWLSLSTAGKRA